MSDSQHYQYSDRLDQYANAQLASAMLVVPEKSQPASCSSGGQKKACSKQAFFQNDVAG
jgi:hypothetical protein